MIRQFVEITTDFDAIHCWPACPYPEVAYLRNEHRHKIYVTVKIEATYDRAIEYFMLKHLVDGVINARFGHAPVKRLYQSSMETVCTQIMYSLMQKYIDTFIEISASEDNQNRSVRIYDPKQK